jgi:hypothetical protein
MDQTVRLRSRPVRFTAALSLLLLLPTARAWAGGYSPEVKRAVNSIKGTEIQRHCDLLASDAYEGREAGKRGAFLSGSYIAWTFRKYGLKPGGDSGGWFQEFALGRGGRGGGGGTSVGEANLLELQILARALQVKHFRYSKEWLPFRFSGTGYACAEAVFAGYGISAPDLEYDDYARLDVKGKIVIVLSHEPQEADPESVFDGTALTKHADPAEKARLAREKGAAGLLVVLNPVHHGEEDPGKVSAAHWPPGEGGTPTEGMPCVCCVPAALKSLLKSEKKDLKRLQEGIDRRLKPERVEFDRCRLAIRVRAAADRAGAGRNVVGIWEGSDPALKEEYVVLGAHYDHIGFGHFASRGKPGEVHNGANDNASGTAGLLALARAVSEFKVETKRTLIFAAFDGEEKGLIGSKHYVSKPAAPLDKTVAMLNMDMIGRGPIRKIKVGGGTLNPTLHLILRRISARFQLGLDMDGLDAFLRNSDQAPFMDKSIPCIFLSSGLFNGLHSHEDDPELLNRKKMEAIVRTMMLVAVEVADLKKRP